MIIKKLYKFRKLEDCKDLERIKDIIDNGFYCNNIFDFNDFNEGVYTKNEYTLNITVAEKLKYRICSFSAEEALNKELMWGHYAGAGKGVAIEIELDNDKNIKKVEYGNNSNFTNIDEILTHKTESWRYESECRYLSKNDEANHLKTDDIGKITKIYFGTPYENLTNSDEIIEKSLSLQIYYKLRTELLDYCSEKNIEFFNYDFHNLSD